VNIAQAAHRLGVHETQIRTLEEHPAGHLATLRDGVVMLVSETTARVYVPEIDDSATGGLVEARSVHVVGEDGPPPLVVPAKPKTAPKRKTSGGSGS
jgi:hypothetical protein